ncbi:Hypothetical predicted protein [Podarcis lilfordi]|uniref:Uncharacterized protein n=1 Tax=Podarcis lilfordi TaxID=74358 RepID=A0AA35L3J9_9SAUR|nr:Hypothetical predicted protein [Podarcis lilfordi]
MTFSMVFFTAGYEAPDAKQAHTSHQPASSLPRSDGHTHLGVTSAFYPRDVICMRLSYWLLLEAKRSVFQVTFQRGDRIATSRERLEAAPIG